MSHRRIIVALTLVAGLAGAVAASSEPRTLAGGDAKFPDWAGMWVKIGRGGLYDPGKPAGRGQEPPLTPEYRAVWEANLAEARNGGQFYNEQVRCLPGSMPRMMVAYEPLEMIVTPAITYVAISFNNEFRRIYTDGRDWPKEQEPTFAGYSIGKWIDEDGDGRFDTLEVETRGMKGSRTFEPTGIPLHKDNMTVVRERIHLDKVNPEILRDDITTFDHALTRPWTITRSYKRDRNPVWVDHICAEGNEYVFIAGETYTIGPDGKLMPTRKDQPPPNLEHFTQRAK